MRNNLLIIFVFFLLCSVNYSQIVTFNSIKEEYESFEYERVLQLSDQLIKQGGVADSLMIEIYLMRAVSFYSIPNEISTRNSFREILKIDKNYQPDPAKISPKLITIFDDVKTEYLKSIQPDITQSDSLDQSQNAFSISYVKGSMLQNVILPGLGQISTGSTLKGIILSAVSVANFGAMVYYINDTNKKEAEYIKETDKLLIREKYNSYNSSYKTRNTLIVTYLIVWLYSQLDLWLFDNPTNQMTSNNRLASFMNFNSPSQLSLNFKIPF